MVDAGRRAEPVFAWTARSRTAVLGIVTPLDHQTASVISRRDVSGPALHGFDCQRGSLGYMPVRVNDSHASAHFAQGPFAKDTIIATHQESGERDHPAAAGRTRILRTPLRCS